MNDGESGTQMMVIASEDVIDSLRRQLADAHYQIALMEAKLAKVAREHGAL